MVRKRFQTTIPVPESQYVRLEGNTSPIGISLLQCPRYLLFFNFHFSFPIVLQRFYHQQSQLRNNSTGEKSHKFDNTNPFVSNIPKYQPSPPPYTLQNISQNSSSEIYHQIPNITSSSLPYESVQITNIPIYHQYKPHSPPQYVANSPKNQFLLNSQTMGSPSPLDIHRQHENHVQYRNNCGHTLTHSHHLTQQEAMERRGSNGENCSDDSGKIIIGNIDGVRDGQGTFIFYIKLKKK